MSNTADLLLLTEISMLQYLSVTICFLIFFPSQILAAEYIVGKQTLKFTPPEGYCLIDNNSVGVEADFFKIQKEAQKKTNNDLLAFFVNCSQLEEVVKNGQSNIENYGMLSVYVDENGETITPEQLTRKKLIELALSQMPKINSTEINKGIAEKIKGTKLEELGLKSGNSKFLGIIDADEMGAYSANIIAAPASSTNAAVTAGLLGQSVIKRLQISLYLYRPFIDRESFNILLKEERKILRDIIENNEPLEVRVKNTDTLVKHEDINNSNDVVSRRVTMPLIFGGIIALLYFLKRLFFRKKK